SSCQGLPSGRQWSGMQPAPTQHRSDNGRPLCARNLADDFSGKSPIAKHAVRACYDALLATEHGRVTAALDHWRTLFSKTSGGDVRSGDLQTGASRFEKLAAWYGIETAGMRTDAMLFSLHTYYALLIRLLVGHVSARLHDSPCPSETFARAVTPEALRHAVEAFYAEEALRPLRVVDCDGSDLFSWYLDAWSPAIQSTVRQLASAWARYDSRPSTVDPMESPDLLKPLYQELFPRAVRHALGEFYTPDWLADHVLDQVGYEGDPRTRLLDPSCGSGTFLMAAIRRIRAWVAAHRDECRLSEAELGQTILQNVVGFDLNPLAIMAARANYLIAVGDLLSDISEAEIPVDLRDSILDPTDAHRPFDCVVGNPPWIAWDNLPADYREATKPLWQHYGLFSLSGNAARHGGGKKDLSMLMLYVSADRYLKPAGRLGMVITQTLFQSKGAGDGFRRFRLGDAGDWLEVRRVDDMVALRPFDDAANWTATITLCKGRPTRYPVPYVQWRAGSENGDFLHRTYQAEPIDADRPSSPWFLRPEGFTARLTDLVGPSDYTAHLGANSGGANGVYWVRVLDQVEDGVLIENVAEKSKRGVDRVQQTIEPELLYPLVRWADVSRFHAEPSVHIILAQDVQTRTGIDPVVMRREHPRTTAYLEQFEPLLRARAAFKRYQADKPFYSMYNIGTYTVAPIKIVWRRMDRRINAAVLEQAEDRLLGRRPIIPQETCAMIPCDSTDEAHYLCAVLNSAIVNFLVTAHSVDGGKGFGTPSMLDFIKLQQFQPSNPLHTELARRSREAHEREKGSGVFSGKQPTSLPPLEQIQLRIDRLAAQLWNLTENELRAIRRT
ncbi:MAG: N-6 DNA methylase, partial [Thermoguttaceae bacterium]